MVNERFMSDGETMGNASITTVAITMLLFGAITSYLFVSTYRRERSMFFATVMIVVLIYSIMSIVSSKATGLLGVIYTGLSFGMIIMSAFMSIFFSIKSGARLREIKQLSAPYREMID